MNNKDILNEAFFKKSFSQKLAKDMPEYKPLDRKSNNSGFGTVIGNGFAVTDTDEVKRRLTGAFGAAFGNNSVKTMASRALKTFPIIVSDNVEPDTVMTLKRLMEEQYAEYINLLVSNQVVDLSAYSTDENGNIAIQALDDISGTDFSKRSIANKAYNGNLTQNDIFGNIPLYNLIRQESVAVPTMDDSVLDSLFEDAVVVSEADVDMVVEFLRENADDIAAILDEASPADPVKDPNAGDKTDSNNHKDIKNNNRYSANRTAKDLITFDQVFDLNNNSLKTDNAKAIAQNSVNRDRVLDALRGYQGTDENGKEIYTRLSNTEMLLDKKMFTASLNRSVGEMLSDPKNSIIRDKFEKATFLLQSMIISGKEYISYVTVRLGIPMSKEVRIDILHNFKSENLISLKTANGADIPGVMNLTKKDVERINRNEKIIKRNLGKMCATTIKDLLQVGAIGLGSAAAGIGVGVATGSISVPAAGTGWLLTFLATNPFMAWAVTPAVVGVGATLIAKLIKRANDKKLLSTKIEGWERVEALIDKIDANQRDVIDRYSKKDESASLAMAIATTTIDSATNIAKDVKPLDTRSSDEKKDDADKEKQIEFLKKQIEDLKKALNTVLKESVLTGIVYRDSAENFVTTELMEETAILCDEIMEEIFADKDMKAQLIAESITTSAPVDIKYIEKKPGKDVLIAPKYSARSALAYGSTEIDRRVAKERRYNQPLIMTIRFKERFDSGDFSDNELVAVIGILGQVIRVPSEEMKYILAKNAEGETLQGFLSGDAKISNVITDLISTSKINKDLKNLPQSADIWKNLEKVAHLAVSNKLAGRKSNNISNAHLIFSQKEVDELRGETGVDYLKDKSLSANLMKRYSAFTMMIANDPGQRVYVFDDPESISWNVVPYSALLSKDNGDQLTAALARLSRERI